MKKNFLEKLYFYKNNTVNLFIMNKNQNKKIKNIVKI